MTNYTLAAAVVGFFEGFIREARWDVNAYRLGFGSDTEGPDQVRVTRGMTTTRERALQNLALRLPKFAETIVGQVGTEAWNKLGLNTQAALISFAYNYGHLTPTLADAVKAGAPLAAIVADVEAREGDNHFVNAKRRFAEAALIASDENG